MVGERVAGDAETLETRAQRAADAFGENIEKSKERAEEMGKGGQVGAPGRDPKLDRFWGMNWDEARKGLLQYSARIAKVAEHLPDLVERGVHAMSRAIRQGQTHLSWQIHIPVNGYVLSKHHAADVEASDVMGTWGYSNDLLRAIGRYNQAQSKINVAPNLVKVGPKRFMLTLNLGFRDS